jgi:hypothetical protein
MANPNPSHRFTKGDPRIWRGGRPKSFPALQELAQQIAHETAKQQKDGVALTVIIDGHSVTVAEMILRQWAQSKNSALQQKFMEVAFGKAPQAVVVSGPDDGPIPVNVVNYRAGIAQAEE